MELGHNFYEGRTIEEVEEEILKEELVKTEPEI